MVQKIYLLCFFLICCQISQSNGFAAEYEEVVVKQGSMVELPVILDKADKLAGIKFVLNYNDKLLSFVEVIKTTHTSQLMHIVNDKKVGKLIIVMAGAKGITGINVPLVILRFSLVEKISGKSKTNVSIQHVEMMSEGLQELSGTIFIPDVIILP
jgi:hypothetical protein